MSQQTYNICITFVQRQTNVEDVGSTLYLLYKCVMFAVVGQRFCEILLFDVPFYPVLFYVQNQVFNVLIKNQETNIIGIGG